MPGGAEYHTYQGFHCDPRTVVEGNTTRQEYYYKDMALLVFNPQGMKISVRHGYLGVDGGCWG